METTEKTTLTEKIITSLKNAAVELEEFRLQAALGKAEAHDIYEDAKKKFNKILHEAIVKIDSAKIVAEEKAAELKTLLETLQVQLALGKAEGKEAFEVQRKKIEHALNALELFLKKHKIANEYSTRVLLEVGKFRVKLDILKLRFELKKLQARITLNDGKNELTKKLLEIKKRLLSSEAEPGWDHFKDEISDAYSHLKKAFVR
jgi:hypothetical protein